MRAYFFHLAFELYPRDSQKEPNNSPDTTIFLPPPGTDIFSDTFPTHGIAPWGGHPKSFHRPSHKRTRTDPGSSKGDSISRSDQKPVDADENYSGGSDKRNSLPSASVEESGRQRDWRFDSVSIISIDMDEAQPDRQGRSRGKSVTHSKATDPVPTGPATRGRYIPSDPKNTEVGWGVVHLYRDADETPGLYDDGSSGSESGGNSSQPGSFDSQTCTTLCILAVPSYMTPADLLGYVGEETREEVSHFKLIRTGQANKYMVLMKFRDAAKAKAWQREWNGKPFNSMEPEYCHVVFVESVTFQATEESEHPTSFPNMTNDPFMPSSPSTSKVANTPSVESSISTSLTAKPLAPPNVELPSCPVCLERMDETTGLLIILCQHVFHCACLEKWRGSGCPVCRYTQNGGFTGLGRSRTSPENVKNACSVCGSDGNLWICLICGNVGCGRYEEGHAHAHYEETKHHYAMDIATQHIWDYAGDGYVHRLVQNKADGKLVDLPAAVWSGKGKDVDGGMAAFGADMVPREKMEAMGNEYTYLLTSQLDSQRQYFEEQLLRAVKKARDAASSAEQAVTEMMSISQQLKKLEIEQAESQTKIENLEKEVIRARKRTEKSDALARKFGSDWKEEKTVNDSLMERIKFLDERIRTEEKKRESLEAEKSELEDQNRDLFLHITNSEKLKDAGEDIVEGTMEVVAQPEASTPTGKKRKGKKQ